MKLTLTPARCLPALILLLLLGACQRAAYRFQPAPEASFQALPAASAPAAAGQLPLRQSAGRVRPVAAAPAARAAAPARRHRRRWLPVGAANAAGPAAAVRPRWAAMRPRLRAVAPAPVPVADQPVRRRSKGVALLLLVGGYVLLGPLGLHNFYLGRPELGVLCIVATYGCLLLLLVGVLSASGGMLGPTATASLVGLIALGVWQLVDAVRIATGALKPRNGEYYPRFFQTRPDQPAAAVPAPPR